MPSRKSRTFFNSMPTFGDDRLELAVAAQCSIACSLLSHSRRSLVQTPNHRHARVTWDPPHAWDQLGNFIHGTSCER